MTHQPVRRIVLTGGPCAGKTSVFREVAKTHGDKVTLVPEAATMLLASGYPMPNRDLEWSAEWRDSFQRAIAGLQTNLEQAYELRARSLGHRIILTDRGLMDGAAYYDSTGDFLAATDTQHQAALSRYRAVIHLESVAVAKPELYSQGNNPCRFETLEQAIPLEAKTRRAWVGHSSHTILEGSDLNYKIQQTLEVIEACLQPD